MYNHSVNTLKSETSFKIYYQEKKSMNKNPCLLKVKINIFFTKLIFWYGVTDFYDFSINFNFVLGGGAELENLHIAWSFPKPWFPQSIFIVVMFYIVVMFNILLAQLLLGGIIMRIIQSQIF